MRRFALSFLLLLVAPASALAGGWATVETSSSAPPANLRPGEPWNFDVKVLQHGRTPAEGLSPEVRIAGDGGTRTFRGTAMNEPGVYRVRVVFPTAGDWRVSIDNDFGGRIDLDPVRIAPGAAVGGGDADASKWWALGIGGAAILLVCALASIALLRDRRPAPRVPPPAAA